MHLSEGFVPIGMQEHGGVLYIASVNKDGKGELGTIPSPIIKPLIKNKTLLEYGDDHTIATANGVTTSTIVSNKLYPGEQFLMALDVCVPETTADAVTYKSASSYKLEWKAELPNGTQKNSYPIITAYDTREHPGVYDICLYVQSKTGLILAPEELWTNAQNYYTNKGLQASSMWFIQGELPESAVIGSQELSKMQDEDYLKTFPGNSQPGYLVVQPVLRAPQIADFGILRRSNGLNVPYTVKRYDSEIISYRTFFPGFWYQLKEDLEKSVYITKIKVSVYNDTDKEQMTIYWTDFGGNIQCSDNPEFEITDYVEDSKQTTEIEKGDEIRSYRKLQHLCVDETNRYYVITTKTNITTELIAQNTDTGLVDDANNRLTDFGGLFYVKFDENWNKWCTLTVDFWSQFDEKLGSYQCKFNPYVNDTFGIVTTSGLKAADKVKMTYGSYSNYTDYKYVRNGSTVDWSKTKISSTDVTSDVTVEHNQTRTTNNTPKIKLNSTSYVENSDSTEVFYKWPQTETLTNTFSAGSYSATIPASNYTKHFVAYKTDIRFQITKAEIYNRVRQLEDATKTWESSDGYKPLGSHTWKSGYDAADNYAFTYFLRDSSGNALTNPNGKFQSLYLQQLQLSLTSGNATTVLNRNTRDALVVGQHKGPDFYGFRNVLSVNGFKETTDPTYTIKLDQFFQTQSKMGKTSTVTDIYMRHVQPILDLNYTTKETFYWGVSKTPYASFIPYVAAQITSEDKKTSNGGKIFTSDEVLTAATVSEEDKMPLLELQYGDKVTPLIKNSWEPTYYKGVKATVESKNATYLFVVSGQKISKWNITIKHGDTEIYTHTGVQDVIPPIVFKGVDGEHITIAIDSGYAVNEMAVYRVNYPNSESDPPCFSDGCCTIYEYNADSIKRNETTTETTTDTTENKTTYNTIVLPLASAYKEAYYNGSLISYTCGTAEFEQNRYIPPLPYVDYTFDNSGNITYYYYCLSGTLNNQQLNKQTTDLSKQSVWVYPDDENSVFGGISQLTIWQFDSSGYNKAKTSFNPVVTAVTDVFTTI